MAKTNNPTTERTLDFLREIIKGKGMNMASFARATGISQQLVYHYLTVKDDMSLFTVQTLLRKIGIELDPELRKNKNTQQEKTTQEVVTVTNKQYIIEGDPILIQERASVPKYILNSIGTGKRLEFLAKELSQLKISEKELCTKLDIKRGMLIYVFEKDDLRISTLYNIAQKLNRTIIWKVKNINPEEAIISPEEIAQQKLTDLIGNVNIIETIHTKGNKFRFRLVVDEGAKLQNQKSMKILSIGPQKNEALIELTI